MQKMKYFSLDPAQKEAFFVLEILEMLQFINFSGN